MYQLTIQADTRSGRNVEVVAAHLTMRLADVVGAERPIAHAKRRGGRVSFSVKLDVDRDAARDVPRAVSDAVSGDGYLNGETGGEVTYLQALVYSDGGTVAFCRMDLKP